MCRLPLDICGKLPSDCLRCRDQYRALNGRRSEEWTLQDAQGGF